MRRLIAKLEVYLDTSPDAVSVTRSLSKWVSKWDGTPAGQWDITIAPNEPNPGNGKADLPTVYAHELGHFLSQSLGTPAAIADLRNMHLAVALYGNADAIFGDSNATKDKYRSEAEAWDMARLIHPGLNETEAANSLGTYPRGEE